MTDRPGTLPEGKQLRKHSTKAGDVNEMDHCRRRMDLFRERIRSGLFEKVIVEFSTDRRVRVEF